MSAATHTAVVTQADRELLAELFDLDRDNARDLMLCAHDGKPRIFAKLERIAEFRAAFQAELLEALEAIKACYPQNSNAHKIASAAIAKARGAA